MKYQAFTQRLKIVAVLFAAATSTTLHAGETLLVKWKSGLEFPEAETGNRQIGSTVKRNFNAIGWQHVQLPRGMSISDGIEAYRALGTVWAVEPNGIIEPILPPVGPAVPSAPGEGDDTSASNDAVRTPRPTIGLHAPTTGIIPNDPRFRDQWYLKKINATNAWSTTTGSTNIVVAIIDTGVDYTHPDLAENMWRNPGETGLDAQGNDKATNGVDDDGNDYIDDVYGVDVRNGTGNPMDAGFRFGTNPPVCHGTAVAGLLAAVGNNQIGIAGLSWSARLMAVRFIGGDLLNPADFTVTRLWSDALAAWDYVLTMKRRGVNIRVTSNPYGLYTASAALGDAIAAAGEEGILCVFAAGNQNANTDLYSHFPQSFDIPCVISVGASTESDTLADFSNYGPSTVDLAAPGVNLLSTWKGSTNYMGGFSGTSGSCPIVAGAAALLLAVNPDLTVDQMKAALFGSVDQPAAFKGKVVTNGRLNVARALEYLTNANPPAIVITALPGGQRTPTNAPIEVTFNRPMNRASVESAFVIIPPVNGRFEWGDDSRSFSFQHDVPFDSTTNFTMRILGTAQDDAGGTLDGDFDRAREGSPADDFVWTCRFPIANDDFANAQWLSGTSGTIQSSNRYATYQLFEPDDHVGDRTSTSSVWYRWTPPEPAEWFTFDLTSGTAFDSLLAVYTGDQLDRLVAIVGNDNYGNRTSSRVSFAAAAGTNYYVLVGGKSADATKRAVAPDQAGNFKLAWYPTPSPGFTGSHFSPSSGAPGGRITLTGTNFTGATAVLFSGASASFQNAPANNSANNLDLRMTAFVPLEARSGPITIVTPHGNGTSAGSFTVLAPDVTPPSVVLVTALAPATTGRASMVTVFFDEEVERASVETVANYSINEGAIAISSAVLRSDFKSVLLSTTPLMAGTDYQITVRNVTDRFPNRNVISTITQTFRATDLVLHLTFDNPAEPGANTAGHSEEGTLIGEPIVNLGFSGSALRFDGVDDYVEIPNGPSLGITGDITISAWVKRETFGDYRAIVAKTAGRNNWDYALYFGAGADTLRFYSDRQSPSEVASTGSVANRNWNHVAVTRRGQKVTFYINGTPAGTVTVTGNFEDNPFPVLVGTDDLDAGQTTMFKGLIDEVRIYNQALSAAEILQLTVPRLEIAVSGGSVLLSWPATNLAFKPETSEDLSSGLWTPVAQAPLLETGQNKLTLTTAPGSRFYRLRRN